MPTVKADICNLAGSRCGQNTTVEDIDSPDKPIEKIFAKWWIPSLMMALKEMKPSFAATRRYLTVDASTPEFGYSYQYAYPADCVAFLGIGDIQDKENSYTPEEGFIRTDAYAGEPLPARMIILVNDVSKYTPEFVEALSWYLAANVNMEITKDVQKQIYLDAALDKRRPQCASVDSQENRPVRISRSKFKESRSSSFPQRNYKK